MIRPLEAPIILKPVLHSQHNVFCILHVPLLIYIHLNTELNMSQPYTTVLNKTACLRADLSHIYMP